MELASKCICCFISALHRIVQLILQIGNLGLKLGDFLLQFSYVALFHPNLLAKARHLPLVVADLVIPLANSAFKSGNLRKELLFSALAGCSHVLLLFLNLAKKFIDAGLQFCSERLSLLIFHHGELLQLSLVVSSQLGDASFKISFHIRLVLCMLRLELGHVLRVLFFELGDLRMELIHLVTCVRCQALNLVFETLNFLKQILYVRFKLHLCIFCLASSVLQSVFKLLNLLL